MAKNKSKNKNKGQQQAPMSPERFMREKAGNLPLGKCYVNSDWQKSGLASIIITRVRPNGKLVMSNFLVDTFCLGVKDAIYITSIDEDDVKAFVDDRELDEISYNEAHNIIYGAIEFAEEGGVSPVKQYYPAAYILEDDTDDIPLIEYEFGRDGKHFLVVNPDRREVKYLNTLKEKLGDDFKYVMPVEDDDFDDTYDDDFEGAWDEESADGSDDLSFNDLMTRALDGFSKIEKEHERCPDEKYSYDYPEYPQALAVKNQFIADEVLSADNFSRLPRETIDRILKLSADEAARDVSQIALYVIGRTYREINAGTISRRTNNAIIHCLILLGALRSEAGLDAVLEILRQNEAFNDYHIGDWDSIIVPAALCTCGLNNVDRIEEFVSQPGLYNFNRYHATQALETIIINYPERRNEIIEVYRRLLNFATENLPERKACDGTYAGLLICGVTELGAKELISEIKDVYKTNCVNLMIPGSCESVIKDIKTGEAPFIREKYKLPDIYEFYDEMDALFTQK